jgi:hypothetical protein
MGDDHEEKEYCEDQIGHRGHVQLRYPMLTTVMKHAAHWPHGIPPFSAVIGVSLMRWG